MYSLFVSSTVLFLACFSAAFPFPFPHPQQNSAVLWENADDLASGTSTHRTARDRLHHVVGRMKNFAKKHKAGIIGFTAAVPVSLAVGAAATVATGGNVVAGAAIGGVSMNCFGNTITIRSRLLVI